MRSWTFVRIILTLLVVSSCSRNPLGEDIQQPILNLAIILSQSCTNNINQDQSYSCQINTSEPIPNLSWSLNPSSTCSWATINPTTGLITGTPNDDQVGNCTLVVDAASGRATASPLSVPVAVANLAPTLTIANAAAITEDDPLTLIRDDLSVQANEEGFGSYSFDHTTTTAPRCNDNAIMLLLNSTTGAVSFAPAANYFGTCNIKVVFDDGNGQANSTVASEFSITVNPVNDAPIITPIADQTTNEDTALVLNFTVIDPDNTLTCATAVTAVSSNLIVVPLANIVFSGTTPNCTATITPIANISGSTTIDLTVSDGFLSGTDSFILNVMPVNDPPVISAIANVTTNESTAAVVNFTITDPDHILTCTGANLSATSSNLTLVPLANIVFGGTAPNCTATITPAAMQSGLSNIAITVSDNGTPNLQATSSFQFTVTPFDDPPVLDPIANQLTMEDTPLVLNFTISDADSAINCATSVSAISSNTTLIPNAAITFAGTAPNCTATLTPNPDEFGASNITFSLTDGVSTVTQSFNFTVNAVNDNPNMPVISGHTMVQDTTDSINFTITDIDSTLDCSASVSITSSNAALIPVANMSIGGTAPNCTLSMTPLALQNGNSTIQLEVTDGFLTDSKSFILTVTSVNYPPTITAIADQIINEDGSVVVNFTINDVDNTLDCSTSLAGTSTNTTLVPNANIVFSGVAPACSATITPVADVSGMANISIEVSDGSLFDTSTFLLTVNAVNDPPTISDITDETINEDGSTSINFTITDIDSSLNCSTSVSATSSNLGLIPVANVVFGGTAPNCTATLTPLADANGSSNLNLTVSDGSLTSSDSFNLNVNAVNDAPIISTVLDQNTNEDTAVVVNFTVNDVDDVLTCSALNLSATSLDGALIPVANIVFGGAIPNCTATITPAANQIGSSTIEITLTDAGTPTLSDSTVFDFNVNPINDPPDVSTIAAQTVSEDNSIGVNFTITDLDSTLDCSTSVSASSTNLGLLPVASIIFSGTAPNCSVQLNPIADQFGSTDVTITVTDGSLTDTTTFTLTVNPINDVPVIDPIADQNIAQDAVLNLNFTINDVDNGLTCNTSVVAVSTNTGLVPNGNIVIGGTAPNCTATITPLALQSGMTQITLTVSDGSLSANESFNLNVSNVDYPPVIDPIANQTFNEDGSVVVNLNITDADTALNCATSLSVTSTNTTLIPVANVVFGGVAPACTATITSSANESGNSNLTITVSDGVLTDDASFTVTVNAVNDAPVLSAIGAQSVNEDGSLVINFTITDIDSTLNCATSMTAGSSNVSLIPVANVVFGGTAPNCTATVTPVANENGVSNLTFTVSDGTDTDFETFAFTVNAINDAPVISSIGAQSVNEDGSLVINFTITDIDTALNCSTSITSNSSNVSLIPIGNIVFGGTAPNCTATVTPVANENGVSNLTFTVSDGTSNDFETFAFTVNAINDPPVLSAIGAQSVNEDGSLVINFTITDIDSTLNCTTSMTAGSSNVSLIPVANVVFGGVAPACTASVTPLADQNGVSNLTFTVSDGTDNDAETFAFTVNPANDAPVLSAIGAQSANEDGSLVINFTITDIDSTLNCATSMTAGSSNLTLVPLANVVFGGTAPNCTATVTPLADQNGVSNLTFTVSDGTDTDFETFAFTVNGVNDAPVLSAIGAQSVNEDGSLVINFTITDIDSTLNCTTSMTAGSSNVSLIPVANVVFGGTAPNCTATVTPLADQNGVSNLTLTVSDGTDNDAETFAFTVNPINDAPVLSAIGAQSVNEDGSLVINFTITDIDSALNCTTSMTAGSSNVGLIPIANIVFGGTAPNCTATVTPLADQNGVSNLTFTVSDGTDNDAETFAFTVNATNDAPVLSAIGAQLVNEDGSLVINFTITDIDSTLNCTTSMTAGSSNLTLVPVANVVFGGTAPNCTATVTPVANENGVSNLTLTVSDGTDNDAETFAFTVNPVNDAPVLSAIGAQSMNENSSLNINFTITDVDSTLNCSTSMTAGSSNLTLVPLANIVFSGTAPNCTATVTPAANQNGISNLTFTVSDGTDNDAETFALTVNIVNNPPILSAIGNQTINEDGSLVINFTITDLDHTLDCTTSMTAGSSNLTLVPVANVVFAGTAPNCTATVTPVAEQSGVSNLTFTVSDGITTDFETFSFTVNAVNDAPILSAIGNQTTNEDTAVVVNFTINDVDSTLLCTSANLSVSSSNTTLVPLANVVFSGTAPNCTATITPAANENGVSNLTITLNDNGTPNLQDSQSFSATVNAINDPPVIAAIANQTNNEDTAHIFTINITDVDSTLDCTTSVTGSSSNTSLLANASIVFSGTTPNCTVTLNPELNINGSSTVTLTVSDGTLSDTETFTYTVNSVNDAPVLSAISNETINEDGSIVINFTANDVDSTLLCTTANLSITSSNVGLIPVANVVYGGTAPNCTATVTPLANQNGTSNFTLTLSDNGTPNLQDSESFTVTVDPVNDAPVQSTIAAQSTNEDTALVINFTISDVDNTLNCSSSMTANTSDTTLLPVANVVFGGTAPNCTATITPAADLSGNVNITFRVSDGTLFQDQTFALTVNAVNDAPILSAIGAQSVNEDGSLVVNFTITDVDNTLNCSTSMTAGSSNTGLIPVANIVYGGTAQNCTATVTPLANQSGVSNLTFTVSDGSLTDAETFAFTVNAVNDAPTISSIADQTTPEDNAIVVNFTINDTDNTLNCSSSVSASSSNTTVQPVAGIVFGGTAPNCTATITPAANQSGLSTITFTVTDGSLTADEVFDLTVTPFDDPPVISSISNINAVEDAAPIAVNFTITDPDTTLNCTTSMSAASTNTSLLPVANIVFSGTAPNCTATLTLVANANGSTDLTFTVTDGNSNVSSNFTLNVSAVNDAPTIAAIAGQSTPEDTAIAVNFTISDVDSTLTCASSVLVTSSNVTLMPAPGSFVFSGTAPNCTVTITPALNRTGSSNVTLFVSDGFLTSQRTFAVTVTAVNDAPTISTILDQSTNEDTASSSIPFTINDVETALTCAGSVTRASSNTTLVPIANIVVSGTAPNCSVVITPTANANGSAQITLTVSDGSLTADSVFNFTVNAINDAPALGAISNQSGSVNASVNINFSASDIDTTIACSSTFLSMSSSNTTLLPNANVTWSGTIPNCTAAINPATGQTGTSTVTFTLNDNSVLAPINQSVTTSFTYTVSNALAATPNPAYVVQGNTVSLAATGGTGSYTWSVVSDPTGGVLDTATGDYTAGASNGTVTLRVNDGVTNYDVTVYVHAGLTLSPTTATLLALGTQTFTATGGYGTRTFSMVSGTGSINPTTGLYTAPNGSGTDVIQVSDQAVPPNTISATIIYTNVLLITPQTLNLPVGSTNIFTAAAGSPAYTYSVFSGGGSVVAGTGVYTAPTAIGSAVVRVTDSVTATSDANVTIIRPTDIVAGGTHMCAIYNNGGVKCWGNNANGQLGIGNTNSVGDVATEIGGANVFTNLDASRTVSKLSAGNAHTCALFTDGNVKCWGSNGSGQLGYGDTTQRGSTTATTPTNLGVINLGAGRTAKDILATNNVTCAVLDNDTVKCWGQATNGMLGNGTTTGNVTSPPASSLTMPGGKTVKSLSAAPSGTHICARLNDDTLACWGVNTRGQVGDGTTTSPRSSPVAATQFTAVLDYAVGRAHTCVILNDGSSTLRCLGTGTDGALGQGNQTHQSTAVTVSVNMTPARISAGNQATCVTNSAGSTTKCWGSALQGFLLTTNTNQNVGDQNNEMGVNLPAFNLGEAAQSFTTSKLVIGTSTNRTNFGCILTSTFRIKCWGGANGGVLLNGSTSANYGDQNGETGGTGMPYLNH